MTEERRRRGYNLRAGHPDGDRGRQIGAPLGWKALVAKYGVEKAHSKTRQYNLDNPSSLERKVMTALDELGIGYLREHVVSTAPYVRVDFKVKYRRVVIEADGAYWHHEDEERQAWREAAIAAAGFKLIRLPEKVILNGSLKNKLKEELAL